MAADVSLLVAFIMEFLNLLLDFCIELLALIMEYALRTPPPLTETALVP